MYIYIYICMYIYNMYICIYVYIYICIYLYHKQFVLLERVCFTQKYHTTIFVRAYFFCICMPICANTS